MPTNSRSRGTETGRGRSMSAGLPTELLTRLVETLRAGVGVDPTLAPLVCAGIQGQPGPLVEVRHALGRWAARTGLPAATAADLVLSSYEALANAADHAYPSGEGPVDLVAARTTDGRVLVTVTDHGQWRPPPHDPGFRGRGLMMIKALSQRAEVTQGPRGTTVLMEWELPAGRPQPE